MTTELEDPYILIFEKKLSNLQAMLPILESARAVQRSAPHHRRGRGRRGSRHARRQQAPWWPEGRCREGTGLRDRRKAMLQEIAILTGGTVISEDVGIKLKSVTIEMLGRAKKVSINKDETTIVDGAGDSEDIKGRVGQIKGQIEEDDVGLRQGEAPGASREARRRCRRHPRRWCHRGRGEGEEGPRRRRPQRDPCGRRGRHRPRWWCGPAARQDRGCQALLRQPGRCGRYQDRAARPRGPGASDRRERRCRRLRRGRQDPRERQHRLRLRRAERRIRQHDRARHHRSEEGRASRPSGRRFDRFAARHDRGDGRRGPEKRDSGHSMPAGGDMGGMGGMGGMGF